ncbi:hemolysin D [Marinobacterium nitratireducens]|uniref:Hemolysin D n=1 Tax=Marinobacterium nitratireducens TaxID=518897 RepID=A0A918DPA8_9GAMM|nr:efflux RND transporter periplasmic adaptor subunit [Marinobacterium nitratireducens]GGO76694.1 hemolysin D [Marinobacterium nitratireducens]
MMRIRILLPLLALVFLVLIVAWMAGVFSDRLEPGLESLPQNTAGEGVPVTVVEQPLFESVPASVGAREATVISSRILARITAIDVRSGDAVKPGQLLIELEQSELRSRELQAQEQIRAVDARLQEAEQNLKRARELIERGLLARADLDRARANYDALVAEKARAEEALEEVRTAVGYTRILSPISGRVVDRFAEPGDTATPGGKLLSLYNPLTLRIEAQVRESLALSLVPGAKLGVEIPSLGIELPAVLDELVPAADPASRSFLVKAQIDYDSRLLPGMYARLQVPAGHRRQLLVPAERIARVGQLNLVWVEVDGRAERRLVRLGRETGLGTFEVLAGLEPDDRLLPPPLGDFR